MPLRRLQVSNSRINEKAARQRGRPSLQGRIVPTEGVCSVKTFWRNLMSPKSGVSRDFWELNTFIFNVLQNVLTTRRICHFGHNLWFHVHKVNRLIDLPVGSRLRPALSEMQRYELNLVGISESSARRNSPQNDAQPPKRHTRN